MASSSSQLISLGRLRVGTEGKFIAVCKADESDEKIVGFAHEPAETPLLNGEADRLFEQYCRELEAIGVTYVWHTLVQGERSAHLISNKNWAHRYLEGDYAKIDALDQAVFNRNANIVFWRDLIDVCDQKQKSLLQERDTDYGLRNGVTLSFDRREYKKGRYETSHSESVTFATDSKTFDLPDFCLANYAMLHEYLQTMTLLSQQILKSTEDMKA